MSVPSVVQAACDTVITAAWTAIGTRQAARPTGAYWQGLVTHAVPPADGLLVAPDVGVNAPSYQGEPWPSIEITVAVPCSLEIHQYVGPEGRGYMGIARVMINGVLNTRILQSGPEAYRVQPWTAVQ